MKRPGKEEVVEWCRTTNSGAKKAAQHFKMSHNTIKDWLFEDRRRTAKPPPATPTPPPPLPPLAPPYKDLLVKAILYDLNRLSGENCETDPYKRQALSHSVARLLSAYPDLLTIEPKTPANSNASRERLLKALGLSGDEPGDN